MWIRAIAGTVLCAVGAVWVAQGVGALGGSGMSGHRQYAVLGAVVLVVGLALLGWAMRVRKARPGSTA